MIGQGCEVVVVACNTATAAAIDVLRREWPGVPFVGMEPAIKPAALGSKTGVVGVLATRGTFNGRLYRKTYALVSGTVKIIETIADELVLADIARERATISSTGLLPYGQYSVSAT